MTLERFKAFVMLAERLSNTESRLPREGAPVAEFGTRFVTRCGTLATQVPEEQEKESGGEGVGRSGVVKPLNYHGLFFRQIQDPPKNPPLKKYFDRPGVNAKLDRRPVAVVSAALKADSVRHDKTCPPRVLSGVRLVIFHQGG